jgi:hypothetical protein
MVAIWSITANDLLSACREDWEVLHIHTAPILSLLSGFKLFLLSLRLKILLQLVLSGQEGQLTILQVCFASVVLDLLVYHLDNNVSTRSKILETQTGAMVFGEKFADGNLSATAELHVLDVRI